MACPRCPLERIVRERAARCVASDALHRLGDHTPVKTTDQNEGNLLAMKAPMLKRGTSRCLYTTS